MSHPSRQLADVITLPARSLGGHAAGVAGSAADQVRVWTANDVDDWGRDNGFVDRVWAASRLRWNVSVGGAQHVPKRKGALIVVNARRFALAPVFAALAIGGATGRPVRFVGRPDVAPVGPMMQRLGGLLPIPREVERALAADQLVVLGAAPHITNRTSGIVDHRIVGAATITKVPAIPAATVSVPLRRSARVEIGAPIRLARKRRGPLDELETADALQHHLDALLDELGGALTGTPLDWLPFNGIGGV
ncbi:MAG: hypothetical protein CL424_11520 [Acidimicrobiaceae bacterium]|nr:hypothetical protein [Acidimicrobiaceae bacterium]